MEEESSRERRRRSYGISVALDLWWGDRFIVNANLGLIWPFDLRWNSAKYSRGGYVELRVGPFYLYGELL